MWYRESAFRNLVDMHIPDWNPEFMSKFDPEAYADCMARAKVDTALVYAGNCLGMCFFPTEVGHMHEGLHGRDLIGETFAALRKRGIRPIMYFNIWSRWAYDTHPEWRIRLANGNDTVGAPGKSRRIRFGCCCLNAKGYRDYVKQQFTQMCRDYDFEGFWVDMCGWHNKICTCNHCRERYLKETGRELPETVDFNDPVWVDFVRYRERWLYDFNKMIRDTVDECKPGTTIAFQSAFWSSAWMSSFTKAYAGLSDYLAGDFYGDALMYSRICKYLSNVSKNRPMEFMTSRCMNLNDHTTTKSKDELKFSCISALLHGAAFLFIDAIDPKGTLDARLYDSMGELKEEVRPYLEHWSPDAELAAEVGFYYNFLSGYSDAANGKSIAEPEENLYFAMRDRLGYAAETMIASHFTYDMTPDAVDKYTVLVLTEQHVIADEDIRKLTAFVEKGGTLIVTGDSGAKNADGRPGMTLEHLTGVKLCGKFEEDTCYFDPCKYSKEVFDGANADYPLFYAGRAVKGMPAPDVEVLAKMRKSFSDSGEIYRFASAISNPPGEATDYAGVTCRRYGKGRVYWMSVPLMESNSPRQKKVFANIVRLALGKGRTMVETDAPSWMEAMIRRDREKNCSYISLYKAMSKYYDTKPMDVQLSVKLGSTCGKLTNAVTGEAVEFTVSDGRIEWTARNVGDSALYIWEE